MYIVRVVVVFTRLPYLWLGVCCFDGSTDRNGCIVFNWITHCNIEFQHDPFIHYRFAVIWTVLIDHVAAKFRQNIWFMCTQAWQLTLICLFISDSSKLIGYREPCAHTAYDSAGKNFHFLGKIVKNCSRMPKNCKRKIERAQHTVHSEGLNHTHDNSIFPEFFIVGNV